MHTCEHTQTHTHTDKHRHCTHNSDKSPRVPSIAWAASVRWRAQSCTHTPTITGAPGTRTHSCTCAQGGYAHVQWAPTAGNAYPARAYSLKNSSECLPPSRPTPLSFTPPNGVRRSLRSAPHSSAPPPRAHTQFGATAARAHTVRRPRSARTHSSAPPPHAHTQFGVAAARAHPAARALARAPV